MNNIYKVIWSKAKNCYVVASEIARSHTKSATGSGKIGGVTRRSLLASLMALSLLCGGLGVAEATVHVVESGVIYEVLTTQEVTEELDKKVSNEVADLTYAKASDVATNTRDIATNKGNISELNGKLTNLTTVVDGKVDKADTLAGYNIKDAYTKGDVDDKLNKKADAANVYTKTDADANFATSAALTTAKNELDGKIDANTTKITDLQTTTAGQAGAIKDLKDRTTNISYDSGKKSTSINGIEIGDTQVDMNGKNLTGVETINGIDLGTKQKGNYISQDGSIWGNMMQVDDQVKTNADAIAQEVTNRETAVTNAKTELEKKIQTNADNIQTNANNIQKTNDYFNAELSKTNNYFNAELSKTNNHFNTELGKTNAALQATNKRTAGIDRIDATNETTIEGNVTVDNLGNVKAKGGVTADGKLKGAGVDAGDGAITTTGAVNAGSLIVTDASNLKGDVTMDKTLKVTGDTSLNNTEVGGALNVTGASDLKGNVILGTTAANTVTVNGKSDFKEAVEMDSGLTVDKGLNVTNGETNLENTTVKGDLKVTGTITTEKMVFGVKPTNYTEIDQGKVTSKNSDINGAGQSITSSSTFDAEKNEVGFVNNATGDQSYHKQTSNVITDTVKNNNTGDQSFHKQTSDVIMDNVKDGKNSNNRTQTKTETKDIITDENGNSSTTSQTASQNKTYLTDKDRKNTNSTIDTAKGYDKTIKGENGETSTKQDELNITNTAKDGTITNDANHIENKANTMDTTVTGKATESYGSLDTTVNGNETHIVKGTKTETVDGKVTENYKAGQATNVTGDQDITVSGTQTTKATDIKRNASSGMSDTIDNDYGTNTETKVAGKTTTDVSIKGTGEEGKYIRGANESRDYLIKGTLKNSETKTVDATSTEITDGKGKTSATIQDVNNLAGSVTNSTETGVSGIHANDNSVSIDSIVTDGNKYSVINQKKGSIQSTVVDGTNSTVILQDKDNVTIASSNGTVGIVGKDIVNNAQNTITNTAGTSITNQVKDSKVTTDANGTTFENNTAAVSDGGKTTTQINGNRITTGRVNANELAVSDKDGANTADFSVKAEDGVKASASNGTTTGSLDVKADEVVSSVKDASGKGSTFKQRIDAIMMESKNVSIKAEETLTNEAKDIVTNASNSITEKVGETNVTTKTTTSSKSEIQNADTITSVQQTENMVQSFVGKKDFSTTNVTTNLVNASANAVTENGQTSTVLNNKDGLLVRNTANGKRFTTADGTNTGTALEWTNVKGNEISTGKVEANYVKMDYADVMKDLGVRGNANITGKTTTGSLEVTGTSTLKGDVTMGSNATVTKDLSVGGTTTTKTLNVTENATVGGTLDVTQKATFHDDVDITKNLSVGGNATITGDVTAKSYKVGDKTYIDANGINANNQKITNVADGSISEGSKDAVNGGQLYTVKNDLEGKVNKVGANAAAMANLHPMEFDPDSKWNIAAAIGNYGSETAAALGAFYRPNDDVMVNLSTAFGTGENMVGGGVSVRLGKGGNKLSREESNALKDQVNDLTARMDALLSVLNPNMSKDFPDVPENHWAYEAVSRLAGNDIVQGYPDGEFHGERTMTRYEMAEIIYNALSRGAEAEKELVEEFKPELQAMAASEKATAERVEG